MGGTCLRNIHTNAGPKVAPWQNGHCYSLPLSVVSMWLIDVYAAILTEGGNQPRYIPYRMTKSGPHHIAAEHITTDQANAAQQINNNNKMRQKLTMWFVSLVTGKLSS